MKSVEINSARNHVSHLEKNLNVKIDQTKLKVETVILDLDTQSGVVLKGHVRERSIVGIWEETSYW